MLAKQNSVILRIYTYITCIFMQLFHTSRVNLSIRYPVVYNAGRGDENAANYRSERCDLETDI